MRRLLFFPIALPLFILLILLVPVALILIMLNIGFAVFEVLGFTPGITALIFLGIIIGSVINIPIHEFTTRREIEGPALFESGVPYRIRWRESKTVLAINVGGGIIPLVLSIYFLTSIPLEAFLVTTSIVSLIAYFTSRPVTGWGVTLPMLIPPLATIAIAYAVLHLQGSLSHLARLAFASGVFGVIIGADLLNLPKMRKSGAPWMSIGGAGTFDGILLTAIFATMAAALIAGG